MGTLIQYLYIVPAALIAIILHELSHGLVSYWLGDPTPKNSGRLSLNPLKHLDPFGLLCLIFFHVGWAKPVMIDSRYYKKQRLGIFLVSLAGPLMNFLLAFIFGLIYVVTAVYLSGTFGQILYYFSMYSIIINVGLGIFNLIPIPPLDGSKIVGSFLPPEQYNQYMKYQRYGMIFLLIIILVLDFIESSGLPNLLEVGLDVVINMIINFWAMVFGVR